MARNALGGHLLAGLATGAFVALGDALIVGHGMARRSGPPSLGIVLAGGMATVLWITWCSVSIGALTLRARPRLARVLTAAALLPLLLFHMVSTTVRAQTGSYLTLTPLQLISASPSVFFRRAVAVDQMGSALLLVAVVGAAIGFCCFFLLPRATAYAATSLRGWIAGLVWVVSATTLVMAVLIPGDTLEMWALRDSSPELALLSSMRSPAWLGIPPVPVEPGLPIARNREWTIAAGSAVGPRPNVALVVLESVRADHLGFMGYPRDVTPNIDRLAKNGLRMERALASATMTSTAVSAMLSSQWGRKRPRLDLFTTLDYPHTLPHDLFGSLGYDHGYISSQTESWFGMRRFIVSGTGSTHLFDADDWKGPVIGITADRCIPDADTVDLAIDWVKGREAGKPWFLYLNLQRTHHPYTLPEGAPEPFQPADPRRSTTSSTRSTKSPRRSTATTTRSPTSTVRSVDSLASSRSAARSITRSSSWSAITAKRSAITARSPTGRRSTSPRARCRS